jgi:hypothetical protein
MNPSRESFNDLLPLPPKFETTLTVEFLVFLLEGAVVCGEFGRDDHLVATAAVGHPLADPFLRLVVW